MNRPETIDGSPGAACSLLWCDGCQNKRPTVSPRTGVIYEGKKLRVNLCRWCRGHQTRRRAANAPGSQDRLVRPQVEYCQTVVEAERHGWVKPYEGGRASDGWRGRIYGRKPGNHRVFRCTKRPNAPGSATSREVL